MAAVKKAFCPTCKFMKDYDEVQVYGQCFDCRSEKRYEHCYVCGQMRPHKDVTDGVCMTCRTKSTFEKTDKQLIGLRDKMREKERLKMWKEQGRCESCGGQLEGYLLDIFELFGKKCTTCGTRHV